MSGSEKSDFNGALAVGRALDLTLPDSHAVREAYAQAKAESSPWLFNHVARSWLYGAQLTQHRGLAPDAELVAVSVLLHDLGLARGRGVHVLAFIAGDIDLTFVSDITVAGLKAKPLVMLTAESVNAPDVATMTVPCDANSKGSSPTSARTTCC